LPEPPLKLEMAMTLSFSPARRVGIWEGLNQGCAVL
jgi:hypothetical protein